MTRVTATNQIGWEIQVLSESGWKDVVNVTFVERTLAEEMLKDMDKVIGAEYRIYPKLKNA